MVFDLNDKNRENKSKIFFKIKIKCKKHESY